MMNTIKKIWINIRRLSGDDAYERYLLQYAEYAQLGKNDHDHDNGQKPQPLSRQEFFKQWQDGKWKGIKRCC